MYQKAIKRTTHLDGLFSFSAISAIRWINQNASRQKRIIIKFHHMFVIKKNDEGATVLDNREREWIN